MLNAQVFFYDTLHDYDHVADVREYELCPGRGKEIARDVTKVHNLYKKVTIQFYNNDTDRLSPTYIIVMGILEGKRWKNYRPLVQSNLDLSILTPLDEWVEMYV
jgi:hypothetical protein